MHINKITNYFICKHIGLNLSQKFHRIVKMNFQKCLFYSSDGDKTAHTDHSVGTLDIGQNICSSYESTKTREDNNPISSVNIIPSK